MPYDARAVANELLDIAKADGQSLTLMQLIKLVYIAHGWHLALSDEPLIAQTVKAWKYGPVIPDLYKAFARAEKANLGDARSVAPDGEVRRLGDDEWANFARLVLQTVWKRYKQFNGLQLSSLTHQQGTPWHDVAKELNFDPRDEVIPNESIRNHYKQLLGEEK